VQPEKKTEPVKTEPVKVVQPEKKTEPVKTEPVKVVQPEKKAEPVRVTPDRVEKAPELPSRTAGSEDYGELSSIFATEEELGLTDTRTIVEPPRKREEPGVKKPVTQQWWFWTIVGVGAAGALAGAGYGIYSAMDSGGPAGYSATVGW
ncbi:MAG: hypothetical protein FJ098_03800, partial [Deltaproteobacteria bacterium]|nr:hypothetical protein [Deltaproteobacteria bacterium]